MKKPIISFLYFILGLIGISVGQSFSELYKKCSPSVVVIQTQEEVQLNSGFVAYDNSLGSGVLIDEEGSILTAAHVVEGAKVIMVKCFNGEIIPADVVRAVPIADVALIKLRKMPQAYTIAKLGNSDLVEIGDEIAIIGTPYGFEYSLSRGIISASYIDRTKTSGFAFAEFFQTDAAVNKGNSGGPMFNLEGEVIGIVSYIVSESGGFEGLGFAATYNISRKMVIDDRKYVGLSGYWLNEKQCELFNVPQKKALLIQHVLDESPADMAGLNGSNIIINMFEEEVKVGGDIILSVNDISLDSEANLFKLISTHMFSEGPETINLTILRKGEILQKQISLD